MKRLSPIAASATRPGATVRARVPALFAVAAVLQVASAAAAETCGVPAPRAGPPSAPAPLNDTDLVGGFDGLAVTTTGKSSLCNGADRRRAGAQRQRKSLVQRDRVDVSTSLPVENATFADYARHELLTRKGGLLNMYRSMTGRNAGDACELTAFRRSMVNRVYVGNSMVGAPRARLSFHKDWAAA